MSRHNIPVLRVTQLSVTPNKVLVADRSIFANGVPDTIGVLLPFGMGINYFERISTDVIGEEVHSWTFSNMSANQKIVIYN